MTIIMPRIHKPSILHDGYRKAERGTLVFAIFNITLTCIAAISSVVGTIFWFATFVVEDLKKPKREPSDGDGLNFLVTYIFFGGIVILMVFCLIAFMFSSFLIHGVCKKKPQHVKAYFVYGVMVTIMSVMSALAYMIITNGTDPLVVAVVLLICAMYSLVLAMIRATYKSYEKQPMLQYNENLLVVATDAPKRI